MMITNTRGFPLLRYLLLGIISFTLLVVQQTQAAEPWRAANSFSGLNTVKKSKSGICHDVHSFYYFQTKYFRAFSTLDQCLASGGRLPKESFRLFWESWHQNAADNTNNAAETRIPEKHATEHQVVDQDVFKQGGSKQGLSKQDSSKQTETPKPKKPKSKQPFEITPKQDVQQAEKVKHTENPLTTKGVSPGQTDGGDPVNLVTGNLYHMETDFQYPARGLPMGFTRTYNSLGIGMGPLGPGWTHNFHQQLRFQDSKPQDSKSQNGALQDGTAQEGTAQEVEPQGSVSQDSGSQKRIASAVVWVDGTGAERRIELRFVSDSHTSGGGLKLQDVHIPKGLYIQFEQTAEGFQITEKNGLTYVFAPVVGQVGDVAPLMAIKDPFGNALTLTYRNQQLVKVTDAQHRSVVFAYNAAGLLHSIRTWANQLFRYQYNEVHQLIAVYPSDEDATSVTAQQPSSEYQYYQQDQGALEHKLKRFRYANGYQMTFEYYANGKVARHYNALGDTMAFKYHKRWRETQTINERGHLERFLFNARGSLIKKVDVQGGIHQHAFSDPNDPFLRTAYTNPLGHTWRYEYSDTGDLVTTQWPSQAVVRYFHSTPQGQPQLIQDANGHFRMHLYSASGQLLEEVQFRRDYQPQWEASLFAPPFTALDHQLRVQQLAAEAEGIVRWRRYQYSDLGHLVKRQQVRDFAQPGSGPYYIYRYLDEDQDRESAYPTSIQFHGDLNGDGVIAPGEGYGPYRFEYDALGRVVKGYDDENYPIAHEYYASGRLALTQDRRGIQTRYQYDASGLLLGMHQASSSQFADNNPSLGAVTFEYDQANRLLKRTDQTGASHRYQYDAMGNLTEVVDPDGYRSQRQYNPAHQLTAMTAADGRVTRYQYDALGRQVSVRYPGGKTQQYGYYGPEGNGWLKEVSRLDTAGQPTRTQTYAYNSGGQVVELRDHLGRSTVRDYDALGRVIRVVSPAYTDAVLGRVHPVVRYQYSTLGFVETIHAGYTQTVADASDDQLSLQATYRYDDLGRTLSVTNALNHRWQWQYNQHGQVLSHSQPQGQVIRNEYDARGFLHKRSAGRPDQPPLSQSYRYHPLGWISESHNGVAHFSYRYDGAGRLLHAQDQHNGKALSYRYTLGGRLQQVSDSDGLEVRYQYDPVGRLLNLEYRLHADELALSADSHLIRFRYDHAGRLASKQLPNEVITEYQYYPDDSLKRLDLLGSKGTRLLEQHSYQYDVAGRVSRYQHRYPLPQTADATLEFVSENANLAFQERHYQYDELDRLTLVYDDQRHYDRLEYDPFGNWRQRTQAIKQGAEPAATYQNRTLTYQHNALHQLLRVYESDAGGAGGEQDVPVGEYQYNANGQLIRRHDTQGELRLSYNALGQLIESYHPAVVIHPGAPPEALSESYRYGPNGRRVQKTRNGQTRYYRYDGDQLWADYSVFTQDQTSTYDQRSTQDQSSTNHPSSIIHPTSSSAQQLNTAAFYIQGLGIDQPLVRIDNHQGAGYYHSDRLGSVTSITNDQGLVQAAVHYSAWGEIDWLDVIHGTSTTSTTQAINSIPTYGYAGREPDATGLIYYRSRYYDPQVGRFTQQDPLGFIDGVNRYAYVMNNPINFVDPWGTMATGPSQSSSFWDNVIDVVDFAQMVTPAGIAKKVAQKVVTRGVGSVAKSVDNSVIGKPRVGSANKTEPTHRFNDIIDNYAGEASKFDIPTKGPGGKVVRTSELRQIEGSQNGKSGVFEWIVDQGNVTHRRFIPGGKVTGFPNQVPKK